MNIRCLKCISCTLEAVIRGPEEGPGASASAGFYCTENKIHRVYLLSADPLPCLKVGDANHLQVDSESEGPDGDR